MAVSFIGGGNRSTGESYRPAESHCQTLSHTDVDTLSSKLMPHHIFHSLSQNNQW